MTFKLNRPATLAGLIVAAVTLVALLIGGIRSADAAKPKPQLAVKVVSGPSISVPPYYVTGVDEYVVRCPSGYVVTGIGVLNGANDVVFADFDYSGRSASFSFSNPSESMAFIASGSVTCVRGERGLRARTAQVTDRRAAVAEARKALR